jgi:hypothetical protein
MTCEVSRNTSFFTARVLTVELFAVKVFIDVRGPVWWALEVERAS